MTVEELKVILELENKNFNRQAEATKRSLESTGNTATSVKDKIRRVFDSILGPSRKASSDITREANRAKDSISKSMDSMAKECGKVKNVIGQTKEALAGLRTAPLLGRMDAGLIDLSDEAKAYTQEIKACEQAIIKLNEAMEGMDPNGENYKALESEAAKYQTVVDELTQKLSNMPKFGLHGMFKDTGAISNIQTLKASLAGLRDYLRGIRSGFAEVFQQTPIGRFATKVGSAFTGVKRFVIGAKNDIGAFGKKILSAASHFHIFGRRASHAGSSIKNFIKSALGIGSLLVLFNRLKTAMKEGFGNLSKYSAQTRQDLAMLKGSLTQVKNSLAVAFAPIVTVIAPLIQTLVNYITAACNALAQFFGALTGQKTVTVASSGLGDLAAGASDVADATGAANDSAQELQRTLMGFDQINKLDDKSSSGGGGSGGGGVGGASGFSTSEIANTYSNWAEKVKEAWENADFYEIGQAAGEKLKNGLQSIDWDKIKAVGEKVAKSVATGLNGFLETPGLFTTVGSTVAEALNTVFNTANTFANAFHWSSLGKAISDSINGFFSTFDFKLAAQTISNWATGFLDTAIAAVQGVNWKQVGQKIAEFIANIKWGDIFSKAFELAGSVVGAVAQAIAGLFEDAVTKVKDYFTGKIEDAGGDIVQGIKDGIVDALISIPEWIDAHIFQPFIKGFKKIFGIASPSKEMKPLGENIMEGLKDGLVAKFTDILDWFKELPGKIAEKIGDLVVNFTAKLTDWKDALKDKAINFTSKMTEWKDALKDKALDFKAMLIDKFKGKGFSSTISDMKAEFTQRVKGSKFVSTLSNMTAEFTKRVKGSKFANTISGMIAKFTGKTDSLTSKQKTFSCTADITKANWKAGNAVLEGNLVKFTKAGGGIYSNGRWKPVTTAASGGSFNTGQMFIAREAGPELVGRIGANTAVMNNDQIVSSVANGVAKAVASVLGNNQTTVILEGDAKKLFTVVRKEATNYTNSTGLSAFPV